MLILFLFLMSWIHIAFGFLWRPYFFCAKVYLHEVFQGFEFWSSSKFIFYLPQSFCKNLGRFLSYEVHHRSHCFVCHSFFLLSHFETPQSSCLLMPISKFLSTSVFQSSCLLVSIPKFLSTYVYLKVLSTSVSQSSCLPVYVSKFMSTMVFPNSYFHLYVSKLLSTNCVSQSSYLLLFVSKFLSTSVCLKALIYQLCGSKLLSTFVCIKVLVY